MWNGDRPRFLLVGCGSIGQRHARNLLSLAAADILAFDVRPDRLNAVRDQLGLRTVNHLDEAWEDRLDAVLVTVPTSLHVPVALEAAERGLHLFIEKPLSDRWDGVQRLLETVRVKNLVTLVGCNMRFHPALLTIKRLVEEGAIGQVLAARVEAGQFLPDWHPNEDYRLSYSARRDLGGGIILDAIHEIDYIRWMLGGVDSVACFSGKLSRLEIETEDTAAIILRFASGAIGEIHLDYVQRPYSRSCHLIGEEGTIRWEHAGEAVRWYSARTAEWNHIPYPASWEPNDMYRDEMRHFLRCLSREEKPALDSFEAARVLEIALAARKSSVTLQVVEVRRDKSPMNSHGAELS